MSVNIQTLDWPRMFIGDKTDLDIRKIKLNYLKISTSRSNACKFSFRSMNVLLQLVSKYTVIRPFFLSK